MAETAVSHAFVLPDDDFQDWFQALQPYLQKFDRVAVVRSPAGNDLNRYRNVTAVAAPETWFQDDPHAHIRRIYPSVVRVDVVDAKTPQAMASILQQRIATNDRFGEQQEPEKHLFDRFVIDWMSLHRPLRVVGTFTDTPAGNAADNPGFDIETVPGAKIVAGVAGTVTKQWQGSQPDDTGLGNYVQVTSKFYTQTYVVTYAGLRSINVPLNTAVNVGDVLGEAAGQSVRVIVQNPPHGRQGFRLPHVVDPMNMIYVQNLRVRPTVDGLRVRSLPDVDKGEIIGQISKSDRLEPLEMHARVLRKVGVEGQWLRVKLPGGKTGYSAAWYMEAVLPGDSKFEGVNILGVNLDAFHPRGIPDPSLLGNLGWVRFGYNVSAQTGSTDIQAAYDRFAPLAEKYVSAGYKVCFTTSHQTYGEGRNEFWPWTAMDDNKWNMLIGPFADMMSRIMQQWAGKGLAHCWQVWNEPDAPMGAEASVAMLPHHYHAMLKAVVPAMRASDPEATIISAGLTGTQMGSNWIKQAVANLPSNAALDGIALHPYGLTSRGPGDPFGHFGSIDPAVQDYGSVLPGKPLWITEWGVIGAPQTAPNEIGDYAIAMISHIKANYRGQVAAFIWYPWAEGMHSAYGIVDQNSQPRPGLTERFLNA